MKKALSLLCLVLPAALGAAEPPQQIDIHNLPGGATIVENVVVPVPSEIFAVLDKLGKPPWQKVLRSTKKIQTPSDREQIALLLGTVIAEGFIAVEAEDVGEIKNIGQTVTNLAKSLRVDKAVTKRANAIIDSADQKNWKAVRKELDAVQHDAQIAMHEINDDNLAQLVSLGGWLRGTEALTVVVKSDYKKDSADLLHQPTLLNYFEKRLEAMPKKMQDKPLVGKMRKGLKEIKPLMGSENDISEKTVGQINTVAEDLNQAIHEKATQ